MKKNHVIDKRKVKLEDFKNGDFIPFMSGRPRRSRVIGEDDITNLVIALNTSDNFDHFLKKV